MEENDSPFRKKSILGEIARTTIRFIRLAKIKFTLKNKFSCGKNFSIGKCFDIRSPRNFYAGDRVGIGKNFTVECNVRIGNDVLISSNVSFVGNDHKFNDPNKTIYTQGRFPCPEIIIEGDTLIGFGATIIGPCTIKKGAIIAAGSVVKGEINGNYIHGGIPAKPIKPRFHEENKISP